MPPTGQLQCVFHLKVYLRKDLHCLVGDNVHNNKNGNNDIKLKCVMVTTNLTNDQLGTKLNTLYIKILRKANGENEWEINLQKQSC